MPNKLKDYLKFKNNPALGLFQAVQDMRQEIKTAITQATTELKDYIISEVEKRTKEIDPTLEKMTRNILKDIEGEQGIQGLKGEKGDTVVGPMGEKGPQGSPGALGDKGESGLRGIRGENGKDGKDGETPEKGVDYFTEIEIKDFLEKVKDDIKMKDVLKQLAELKRLIERLDKTQQFGGRTLHRGGIDFVWNELLGTGDGVTTVFTLANTPYSTTELVIKVGPADMFLTEDYTLSGKEITFLIAPPLGEKVRAVIYRK